MATERKLDIFKVLNAANAQNVKFYGGLSEEEKKAYVPSVTARWMSGTTNAAQVIMINEFLNPRLFSLYKHPQLLWQLTTIVNTGKNQRYSWLKQPSRKGASKPNAMKAVMEYYGYSSKHAADALRLLSRDDVLEIAGELGWQADEIAKIKKEVKASKEDSTDMKQDTDGPPLLEF